MKFTTIVSTIAVTLASVQEVASAGIPPFCAISCFNTVMNHPAAKTCTEANMYLCMCKIPVLSQAYKDCACSSTCSSASSKKAALQYGKQICVEQGAPVNYPDTC